MRDDGEGAESRAAESRYQRVVRKTKSTDAGRLQRGQQISGIDVIRAFDDDNLWPGRVIVYCGRIEGPAIQQLEWNRRKKKADKKRDQATGNAIAKILGRAQPLPHRACPATSLPLLSAAAQKSRPPTPPDAMTATVMLQAILASTGEPGAGYQMSPPVSR
ncbi:hypothetical protein [Qipengyuania sp.]|uniref:hypothetical protein n=1 Tax=Qipengyuania sp. TaxID=2004515 RepID=UPI003735E0C3